MLVVDLFSGFKSFMICGSERLLRCRNHESCRGPGIGTRIWVSFLCRVAFDAEQEIATKEHFLSKQLRQWVGSLLYDASHGWWPGIPGSVLDSVAISGENCGKGTGFGLYGALPSSFAIHEYFFGYQVVHHGNVTPVARRHEVSHISFGSSLLDGRQMIVSESIRDHL